MLLRRHDFLSVGGFDPDFHMYLEDVDLCRRFRERGMDVVREPASVVVHLGGRSWRSGVDQRERFQTSKIKYFTKAGASPAQLAYLNALGAARVLAARCWLPVRRVWS
jgi:GT2 family glycosyltransferase